MSLPAIDVCKKVREKVFKVQFSFSQESESDSFMLNESLESISSDNMGHVHELKSLRHQWGGTYDYYGQIDPITHKEHGLGRRCWHGKDKHTPSSIEEG